MDKWQPPPAGMMKCNVDVALLAVENFPSADWVLRREDGLFVQACQKMMMGPRNPRLHEVVNLPEALIWMKSKAFRQVAVLFNSLLLVQPLHGINDETNYFGIVVERCRGLLAELDGCSIRFA
ncbi:hypothetical protein P3X46_008953 [Hevea brasiliensis]|uniref:RNase H type-1 domain-containing protein n=1 Tax=Hevea brasiliensis TaxID=3981 RepID=A0ABQ9MNT1_HEVBR|nr:hypothetical protein P3X46_008953 [Hevea brasiliensis]